MSCSQVLFFHSAWEWENRTGLHTEFFGGGGKNYAHRAMPPRGGLRVCSPREVLKFTCPEVASGAPKRLEIKLLMNY